MLAGLYGIVSLIGKLNDGAIQEKAKDPSSALSILIGAESRPMNWCPSDVESIESTDGKVLAELKVEISKYCELMVNVAEVNKDKKNASQSLVLVAKGKSKKVELYLDSLNNLIADGMPFRSEQLLQLIKNKGFRPE